MGPQRGLKHPMTYAQRFVRYYLSAFFVIVMLLVANQGVIQYTLIKEVSTRNMGAVFGRQQKRVLSLESDAQSLQTAHTAAERKHYLLDFETILGAIEATQQAGYYGNRSMHVPPRLPDAAEAMIKSSIPDYVALDAASQQIITIEDQAYPTSIEPQITVIQQHRPNYQQTFLQVLNIFSGQADQLVNTVRLIELLLFIFTLFMLVGEFFLVVLPATRSLEIIETQKL